MTDQPPPEVLYVQFSDDGQHIRRWATLPFDGATRYAEAVAIPTMKLGPIE